MGRTKKFTDEQLWEHTKELLLQVGYDAFTVSLLAEKMNVSRAVIYKYYPNKEELVIQFMLEMMNQSVAYLTEVDHTQSFRQMFHDVLTRIYQMKDLHQVLGQSVKISNVSGIVVEKKAILSSMHNDMYKPLIFLITKGKEEGLIETGKDNFLLLSFIFSVINIPNHSEMDEQLFLNEIEQLLLGGMIK